MAGQADIRLALAGVAALGGAWSAALWDLMPWTDAAALGVLAVILLVGLRQILRHLNQAQAIVALMPLGLVVLLFSVIQGLLVWQAALALAAGLLALVTYVLSITPVLRQVLGRVALALLPFIVVAGGVVFWVAVAPIEEAAIKTGLITGTALATGWLATSAANEYRALSERDMLRNDVLIALQNEIFTIFEKLDGIAHLKAADDVVGDIRKGGDPQSDLLGRSTNTPYHPFVGKESPPVVFDALADKVPIIATETVKPVLRFYAVFSDLRSLSDDFRTEDFRALSADRRIKAYVVLTKLRLDTLDYGFLALTAISRELDPDDPGDVKRVLDKAGNLMNPAVPYQRNEMRAQGRVAS